MNFGITIQLRATSLTPHFTYKYEPLFIMPVLSDREALLGGVQLGFRLQARFKSVPCVFSLHGLKEKPLSGTRDEGRCSRS